MYLVYMLYPICCLTELNKLLWKYANENILHFLHYEHV